MKTITEYIAIDEKWVKVISEQDAYSSKTQNIYFLDGVREDLVYWQGTRAKDADIAKKAMFVLDLDIRNNFKEEISNEDIKKIWKTFIDFLEEDDEYFWEWSKIVFTWNWLHIYYTWEPTSFTKEEYSMWVERIYRRWDKFMWEPYQTDHACKNLARILRLPWSIKQKNWALVEVIAERKINSRLFSMIKTFAKKEMQEQEELKQKKQKEIESMLQNFSKDDNKFYEQINSIPAYEIAQILLPEFPYDWKKNFKNKKWGFTWYFYCNDTNTICNWGSRYFNEWSVWSCYNNFSLMKMHKWLDNRQTFAIFKKLLK